MVKKLDLTGERYGKLVVLRENGKDEQGKIMYLCKCDCGAYITVRAYSLRNGDCKSCGCLRSELSSKRNKTHGYSQEKLYKVWLNMKDRCYNPENKAYARYGQRGIKVCEEWKNNYEAFKDFMISQGYDEYGLSYENTVDRIDNDGDYCPENCRVVTMREQSLNKSNNHYITYNLKKTTVTEAANENGLDNHTVFNRLNKGWSMDKALHQPLFEAKTFTAEGKTHTISEWAIIMGVTDAVVRGRLRTKTFDQIYNEWKERKVLKVNDFSEKFETANGETHNRKWWWEKLGITDKTLRKLLNTYTMQEIYDDWKSHDGRLTIIRSNKLETANGISLSRKEWGEKLQICQKTLRKLRKTHSMQEVYDMYKDRIKE